MLRHIRYFFSAVLILRLNRQASIVAENWQGESNARTDTRPLLVEEANENNYSLPLLHVSRQESDQSEESTWIAGIPEGDQLNALLNCKPFANIMKLLRKFERELNPRRASNVSDNPGRARFWARKLQLQMRRLSRLCLPLHSLKDILENRQSASRIALGHQNVQSHSTNSKHDSNDARTQHISSNRPASIGNVRKAQNTRDSHSQFYPGRPNTRRKSVSADNSDISRASRNYHLRMGNFIRDMVQMLERNSAFDIVIILQRLVDLEDGPSLQPPSPVLSNNGYNMQVEIGGLLREVSPYFLSVALGSKIMQHGLLRHIGRSKKFQTLTRGLSPAMLRMGGSAANFLTFDPEGNNYDEREERYENVFNKASQNYHIRVSPETLLNTETGQSDVSRNIRQKSQTGFAGGGPLTKSLTRVPSSEVSREDAISKNNDGPSFLNLDGTPFNFPLDSGTSTTETFDNQEMADEESEDDCVFDFKWHSHYRTKPHNGSTYDILKAMLSASKDKNTTEIHVDERVNMQDEPYVSEIDACDYYHEADFTNFTISGKDWSRLANFAKSAGMTLIFDLNQFYRTPEGHWDPSNAKLILHKAVSRNDSVIWQLGNEPNAYKFHFGLDFTGKRGAQDFHQLEKELKKVFHQATLIGPDVTRPKHPAPGLEDEEQRDVCKGSVRYLKEFFRNLKVNLTALTWHQYYLDGRTTTMDDFTSTEVLNQLSWQIAQVVELRDEYATNTPIWLTETSSAWGGGADSLSNGYVAGFLWLDKLGISAANGVDMVARQTLIYGSYALVDKDFNPYPDYWLSLLYKRLVGERVLSLNLAADPSSSKDQDKVRLYAHCQKESSSSYELGNAVIFGMNLGNVTAFVTVKNVNPNYVVQQYLLQPQDDELTSSKVLLNGALLEMTSDKALPELNPLRLTQKEIHIPSQSFGFWVIANASVEDCF